MRKWLCVLISFVSLQQAGAGELADKKLWEKVDGYMKESNENLAAAESCGVKLPAEIDRKSFPNDKRELARYCASAVDAVAYYCRQNAGEKAEIMKAVKSLKCHYDASLKKDKNHALKITFKGGVLDLSLNDDSSNFDDEVKEVLSKEL